MLAEGGPDAGWRVIELGAKLGTVLTGAGKTLDGGLVDDRGELDRLDGAGQTLESMK